MPWPSSGTRQGRGGPSAREMPGDLLNIVDVRRFGPGERIVPQPYTKEMFERTQVWMQAWDLLDPTSQPVPAYEATVLV